MSDNELPVHVKRSLELTISHPGWWVVAFFTTLVIDRPLQFIFASQYLTGNRDVFPSILDLTAERGSLLTLVIIVTAVLLLLGKGLDYLSQATLVCLVEGEASGEPGEMGQSLRRGARAFARYALAVLPVDLARYALYLVPGLTWLIWRHFDPGFHKWCAYLVFNLIWLFTCLPLAVALGIFSELAGRQVMLGGSRAPQAWKAAWELGWGNRREVLAAWLPTLVADLAVAVVFLGMSFAGAYLLFLLRPDAGTGMAWDLISTACFILMLFFAKVVHSAAQTFKSAVWTLTYLDLGLC
jgi:hypothetical protein